jgi:hypothetical protein
MIQLDNGFVETGPWFPMVVAVPSAVCGRITIALILQIGAAMNLHATLGTSAL